jgi:hypothetical protein
MAITKIQAGALPADVITTAAIDDASITHAKLHTTMDLSSKTVTLPTLNQSLTLDGPDAGVAKLRLQAEEVHGDIEGINIGNNYGGLAFKTNNNGTVAERVRIDNAGNVGIGTSSFGAIYDKLAVAGGINIQDDNSGKLEIGRYGSGAPNSYIKLGANSSSLRFTNNADNADLVTIENGGNVGIGTSSPSSMLNLKDWSGDGPVIRLDGAGQNSANTLLGALEFYNADNSADGPNVTGAIRHYSAESLGQGGYTTFHTHDGTEGGEGSDAPERVRIDSSGNVLFGGITDKNVFNDTSGTGASINNDAGEMQIKNASDTCLYLNRTGSNGTIVSLRKDGTQIGIIGVADASAKMSIIGTNENLQIGANGANVFNVSTNSVYPQTDNTVDVGFSASGNRFKDLHLSGAINQKNNTKIECINTQSNVGDLVFSTRYSTLGEKVRITGLGYLLVGKANASLASTNTGVVLNKNGVSSINSGSDTNMIFARAGTGTMIVFRANNVTTAGTISVSASSTAYNTSSDYRLKENVVDLTGASARVNQLNPSRFNWIADETNTLVDGFLAHEVADVVPEAIHGTHNEVEVWKDNEELPDGVSAGDNKLDDDGNTIPVYQGIDQSKLVPLLTAALQEALAEIASLKTRVEALE